MYQIYKITNKLSANIKNFIEKIISLKIIFMFSFKKQKIQWNILAISILGKNQVYLQGI